MRKLILTVAGMLMVGMIAVNAQDTLNTNKPQTQSQSGYNTQVPKDFVTIKVDDVPSSLRTTLRGDEYTGWESGTFYQNKSTNQYLVQVGTGNDMKSYYFDRGGKRVKDPGMKP
jgi:hypothetical protein